MSRIEQVVSLLVASTMALVGVLLASAAWNAWDPLPPNGPRLADADRVYEIFFGLIGLTLLAGGVWLAVRVARRMVRRAP